ncbi:hypothetical protein SAMN05443572_102486 [Myxococcus fulvus]|nr:hypothetical protein [Myxococcus fulvus]SET49684.1 hypothetical protein SAMN05443572_102486 [Myxococcus fulvus]
MMFDVVDSVDEADSVVTLDVVAPAAPTLLDEVGRVAGADSVVTADAATPTAPMLFDVVDSVDEADSVVTLDVVAPAAPTLLDAVGRVVEADSVVPVDAFSPASSVLVDGVGCVVEADSVVPVDAVTPASSVLVDGVGCVDEADSVVLVDAVTPGLSMRLDTGCVDGADSVVPSGAGTPAAPTPVDAVGCVDEADSVVPVVADVAGGTPAAPGLFDEWVACVAGPGSVMPVMGDTPSALVMFVRLGVDELGSVVLPVATDVLRGTPGPLETFSVLDSTESVVWVDGVSAVVPVDADVTAWVRSLVPGPEEVVGSTDWKAPSSLVGAVPNVSAASGLVEASAPVDEVAEGSELSVTDSKRDATFAVEAGADGRCVASDRASEMEAESAVVAGSVVAAGCAVDDEGVVSRASKSSPKSASAVSVDRDAVAPSDSAVSGRASVGPEASAGSSSSGPNRLAVMSKSSPVSPTEVSGGGAVLASTCACAGSA